jgi:hypothetical protein
MVAKRGIEFISKFLTHFPEDGDKKAFSNALNAMRMFVLSTSDK